MAKDNSVDVHNNSNADSKNSITIFPVSGVKYNENLANKILDQTFDSEKDDRSLHNDDNMEHGTHVQYEQNIEDTLQSLIRNKKCPKIKCVSLTSYASISCA